LLILICFVLFLIVYRYAYIIKFALYVIVAIVVVVDGMKEKKSKLLNEACRPMPGAEEAVEELHRERKSDEKRLERKMPKNKKIT